ncbi:MAG: response regulator [Acidobacteriota bacterium]
MDDEECLREAIVQFFTTMGLTAMGAEDGFAALSQAVLHAPAVLVVDLTMPRMSGEQLCEELRRRMSPTPPVILMSGDPAGPSRAAALRPYRFFPKPIDLEALLGCVRGALDAESDARTRRSAGENHEQDSL